jgi:GNAT superfamily N-acetyltransferase
MPGVRPLADQDLPQAQKIVRTAFGTFFGAPDLDNFWTDFDYVYGRYGAEHVASFAADDEKGHLAGVNFATRWGSVGFFGPLSVRPDLWDKGVATPLVAAVSNQFERWGVSHAGLCTFPHSVKHVWLYQKFGFYPRNLTAIMAAPARPGGGLAVSRYSQLAAGERQEAETASRALSEELFEGLDLGGEIRTVAARNLGDTIFLRGGESHLDSFAVCHWGLASEAGDDCLFVKFGAARPGPGAGARFGALLDACGALALSVRVGNVLAGVSTAREEAYRQMMARGFRTRIQVVTMHRPNEPAYSRPGLFVLDDWR